MSDDKDPVLLGLYYDTKNEAEYYKVKIGMLKKESSDLRALNAEMAKAAKEVMDALDKHGPSIVPHLVDTDENAGQRLRELIAKAEPQNSSKETGGAK